MTKLRPFFITVIFVTERNPINTKFFVLVACLDPEWNLQFQKPVIIKIMVKNNQVTTLYRKKERKPKNAQKYQVTALLHKTVENFRHNTKTLLPSKEYNIFQH